MNPDKTVPIVSWSTPPRPASKSPKAFLASFLGLVISLGLISVIFSPNFYQIFFIFKINLTTTVFISQNGLYNNMDLEPLESNSENDYIDKKLQGMVNKSLSMFKSSSTNRGVKLPKLLGADKSTSRDLENVSEMLTKMLGKDLDDKEKMEFNLGLMELIDNVESKYIENATTRGIINKVVFMLLMRFKGNEQG